MENRKEIKILFFGDLVGRVARIGLTKYLESRSKNENCPIFVVANAENASHGFGLTEKNYNELTQIGIDCLTSGNHIWDKKEIFNYIDNAPKLVRPINYPQGTAGCGVRIFEKNGVKIGVINALGRVFMPPINDPIDSLSLAVANIKSDVDYIFIDFHAEATAEKICVGRKMSEIGVNAFVGTHTHVPTADEQIINNMAYISDVGFCGAFDSVIGMEYKSSLKRMTTLMPERYEVASGGLCVINAVEISLIDGVATDIKRINEKIDINNEQEVTVEHHDG